MMGKQNIAIRGHQDEDSSFMAMLSLLVKENSVRRDHLENAPQISTYTSPDIQSEIIFFSAKQILDGIIDNCKRSVIYALISRLMLQTESKFLFVYVLLAGKRTGTISYITIPYFCPCRQRN